MVFKAKIQADSISQNGSQFQKYIQKAFKAPENQSLLFSDEPQILDWENYIKESQTKGIYKTLKSYLVQFAFPIQKGISQTEVYRAATLKGKSTDKISTATGLVLNDPDQLQLFLYPTCVGRIPVLIVENRADFVSIVRALSYKNEPISIPDSMGAAMIKGLNNWSRLRRALMQLDRKVVLQKKAFYQDKLIVLSRIPYSNISVSEMRVLSKGKLRNEEDWLDKSLKIRLHHECVHYFTLRYYGEMCNHLHDEILADYMGVCKVLNQFNESWFLKFMGMNSSGEWLPSGRLFNYLSHFPKSPENIFQLQMMMVRAAKNIATFDQIIQAKNLDPNRLKRLVTLSELSLFQMANKNGALSMLEVYEQKTTRLL